MYGHTQGFPRMDTHNTVMYVGFHVWTHYLVLMYGVLIRFIVYGHASRVFTLDDWVVSIHEKPGWCPYMKNLGMCPYMENLDVCPFMKNLGMFQ